MRRKATRPCPEAADLVGVALAGGASRRMGRDKALLPLASGTLLEATVERLRTVCGEVVVADGGRVKLPGYLSVPDGPGRGPAAGILGVARLRPERSLLVLACDLPNVPVALLERLAGVECDWGVPRWRSGIEPLSALYTPRAVEALSRQVEDGRWALRELVHAEDLRIGYLEGEELAALGDPSELFLNLNTAGDLERYRSSS